MLTLETVTDLRNRLYVDRLGYAYCYECAPETAHHGRAAYRGKTQEFIDTCRVCHSNIADKPETVTGTAVIEHIACKIF